MPPGASPSETNEPGRTGAMLSKRRFSARHVQFYQFADSVSEGLVYLSLIFAPWALGTTQQWSIRCMNFCGLLLGGLLGFKLLLRARVSYAPPVWFALTSQTSKRTRFLIYSLVVLTFVLLAYCLISAVNARSTYHDLELTFDYHHYLPWLPHTFDSVRTWQWFWNYSALACFFWATWDWLRGKSTDEQFADRRVTATGQLAERQSKKGGSFLPARLTGLLWIIAINAAVLGLESILQRVLGSSKLLFLVQPRVNPEGESQFGAWAYRANAASYFNLVWPVAIGFWWTLIRQRGFRDFTGWLLVLCVVLTAACPVVSTSRGGALISAGLGILAVAYLAVCEFLFACDGQPNKYRAPLVVALAVLAGLMFAYGIGGNALARRMEDFSAGFGGREEMYERAQPIISDYPVFGTGPGTFEPVFQIYRTSTDTYWPAQLHNDWLETLVTFGWVGTVLIAAAMGVVLARWFSPGGIHGPRRFVGLVWLAFAGVLVHARWDFPFQIYSILHLFVILSAVLFTTTRKAG